MNRYWLSAALIFSFNTFAAVNVPLEGTYACNGNELGTGEAYSCEMIIKKTGATYASTATCSDGNTYRGTGIYDNNWHRLSTVFVNPNKPEETGVCISLIKPYGQFTTKWTYLDKTSIAYSTCYRKEG